MLGSGCVPADARFLSGLANAAQQAGAIFITDEVMTSRHGPRGLADLLGVRPDIATFGKYFAGGFSFGAFAGRAELLDHFDADEARFDSRTPERSTTTSPPCRPVAWCWANCSRPTRQSR